jgi:integrase
VSGKARAAQTFTADQIRIVLNGIAQDRNRHAWHMALAGMRRGEIAGQRWEDIDLENELIRIGRTRLDIKGKAVESDDAKSESSNRTLPLPAPLLAELKAAKARQAAEKLYLGGAYRELGYVVCNEAGDPYHPSTLSKLWSAAIADLEVPKFRLHDARHTCATLMTLQKVPIVLVAAWLGHADVSFTMRTYVHSQPDTLKEAADSFNRRTTGA